MRIPTKIAAAALIGPAALFGSGIGSGMALADSDLEKEACRLMDDPAGAESGYAPAEYAFMRLRAKMSSTAARNLMSMATQNYCPNHIIDLPASWR